MDANKNDNHSLGGLGLVYELVAEMLPTEVRPTSFSQIPFRVR